MAHKTIRTTLLGIAAALAVGQMLYTDTADARGFRGFARTNINRDFNRNFDRNINRNVNRNVNVDVDRRGWGYHPVATGVAIGATAAVTAAVVGSVVYSLPPSCTSVVVGGVGYQQCWQHLVPAAIRRFQRDLRGGQPAELIAVPEQMERICQGGVSVAVAGPSRRAMNPPLRSWVRPAALREMGMRRILWH